MSRTQSTTKLSGAEKAWYYLINIVSLGWLYFVKLAVKKALTEIAADEIIRREEMRGELRMPGPQPTAPLL